jgi:predicted alpha/beta-fold hydrolase
LTVGGHRQTLLGYALRSRLTWTLPVQDHVVESTGDVRLLIRASWQPGAPEDHPLLVLVHGLGGSDASAYMLSTGLAAYRRGFHVLRANMRGAGDGESICPRLYNAGLDEDLLAVLGFAARWAKRIVVVGFSLGGNLILLAAGRQRTKLPEAVSRLAVVSTPLDLEACAASLEWTGNRVYQHYFMQACARATTAPGPGPRALRSRPGAAGADSQGVRRGHHRALRRLRQRPRVLPALEQRTLAPVDRPAHPDRERRRRSHGPHRIDPGWPLPASGLVTREVSATGGHVGFVGRSRAPGHFWAADRVLDFVETA